MVCVDVMSTAGALLTVLVIKTRLAGAAFSAHHMRALATASTSTSDVVCVAEGQACGLDAECLACAEAYDAAVDSCIPSVTTGTCDELEDVMCCASSGCEDNAAYSTFLGCFNGDLGCGVIDVSACASGGGGAVFDSTTTTTSPPTTAATSPPTTTTSDRALPTTAPTAGTTTTAATDDTTSSATDLCQAEQDACLGDPACFACAESIVAEADGIEATCEPAGYDTDTATCDERFEVGCCNLEEGPACSTTEPLLVAWIDCQAQVVGGCAFSVADCAAGTDSSTLVGGDDATSPPTTATTSDRALPTTSPTDSSTTSTTPAADDDDGTSSFTELCQAEITACVDDEACLSCLQEIDATVEAVEAACNPAGFDEDTATCSEREEPACCGVEEGPACVAELDDVLVAVLDCGFQQVRGCDFSITECVAGTATDADDGAGLPFLGGDDDEDGDAEDADAADADTDSAGRSAAVGGTAAVIAAAAAVSMAFMNA